MSAGSDRGGNGSVRSMGQTVLQVAALGLLMPFAPAAAEVNVSVLHVERQQSYASDRVYAGNTIASRSVELGFGRGGEVDEILVDVGDRVAAEQPLARLDMRALRSRERQAQADVSLARANLIAADARAQLAASTHARLLSLRGHGHVSQQELDESHLQQRTRRAELSVASAGLERALAALEAVQVELVDAVMEAPFAGVIQARHLDEGAQVSAATSVLRLVETAIVEAHVGVPADVGEALVPGEDLPVRWNNREFRAHLVAVLPEIDTRSRTMTAVLRLPGSEVPLGAVVELRLSRMTDEPGFWLPLNALTAAERGLWGVYVIGDQDIVELRLVEILHTEADRAFVRGTLSGNERVVKSGVQRIVPGQKVMVSGDEAPGGMSVSSHAG